MGPEQPRDAVSAARPGFARVVRAAGGGGPRIRAPGACSTVAVGQTAQHTIQPVDHTREVQPIQGCFVLFGVRVSVRVYS